jgi:hypothetical protein
MREIADSFELLSGTFVIPSKTSCNPPREDEEIPGPKFPSRGDLAACVVCGWSRPRRRKSHARQRRRGTRLAAILRSAGGASGRIKLVRIQSN